MSDATAPSAAPTGTPADGQATAAAATSPFFSFTGPDGKVETFQTQDDLNRAFKDSYLRRSDYTRKTQEIGNQRKQFETERSRFEEERKAHQKEREKYDNISKRLKERPDVARRLEALASGAAEPSDILEASRGYADEKYTALEEKLNQLVKEREVEKFDAELERIYGKLSQEFPDFDRSASEAHLRELSDGNTEALLRLIYHAQRGMLSPAQLEQRMVAAREQKANARMPPSGSAPKAKTSYKNVDEALEAAEREWAGKR